MTAKFPQQHNPGTILQIDKIQIWQYEFLEWSNLYYLLIYRVLKYYNIFLLTPSPMIVQDAQIMPSSMSEIFKNPNQRQRILKIIIQTLYNLGYDQSAAELQSQSKITYLTPEVKAIKQALPMQNYEQAEKLLEKTSKFGEVKEILNQLKCMKMIREGKMQQALYLIQNQIKQTKKQDELSQQLMMGSGEVKPQILKKKHDYIIETCFDCDISPNSMFKMINCYIELQKRGLTSGISPEFSLLRKPLSLRGPPMRVIQTVTSLNIKNISFLKFNRKGNKVLAVSSNRKQKSMSIWNFHAQKQVLTEDKNCVFTIQQQIINISWSYEEPELIAVATNNHICVFTSDFKTKHKKKISTGLHHNNKILCINWNSLTNFLYVGGSFENIKVYGPTLQQILTIQPFIRTRNIHFSSEGTHMYAISATKGLFTYYNLFQNKEEAQFQTQDVITSFRIENKDRDLIVVTEKKIFYISVDFNKSNKFNIVYSFENKFSQNGLVQIQACLFYPWVVCLGQKQFLAYSLEKDISKQQKWSSKESFTFDISDKFMVSGSKQLYLWTTRTFHDEIQSQNEQFALQIEEEKNMIQNGSIQQPENQSSENENNMQQENESDEDIIEEDNEQF